jgi:hypothetical protein
MRPIPRHILYVDRDKSIDPATGVFLPEFYKFMTDQYGTASGAWARDYMYYSRTGDNNKIVIFIFKEDPEFAMMFKLKYG